MNYFKQMTEKIKTIIMIIIIVMIIVVDRAPNAEAGTTNLNSCATLNTAGETYMLQSDVVSDGSCFFINANNVVLDLNGHTVTYDNATPITIPNNSFESDLAGSWDISGATNASQFAGSFLASTVYDGSKSLKVTTPTADQIVKQAGTITLQPNTTYSITAMEYNQVADAVTMEIGLMDTNDQVITGSNATISGKSWRGSQYFLASYKTGASPVTAKVYLKVSNVGSVASGAVYFDDIKVQRHQVHGINIGNVFTPIKASDQPAGLNGSALAATITSSVAGGKIVQGQDNGSYSNAIIVSGNYARDFIIENLEITTQGSNSRPMYLEGCVGTDPANNKFCQVRNNLIHNNTRTIKSRDNNDGSAIHVVYASTGGKIYNNTITSSPQVGIYFNAVNSGETGTLNEIYGNNITMQTYYSNGFGIFATYANIRDNNIDCSTGNNSCRGIHYGLAASYPTYGGKIYNNTVAVQELPRNQEYGGCTLNGAYGIQLEDKANDVEVYGNDVTAYATSCNSAAVRASTDINMVNNNFHDNIFSAIATGANKAYSIRFESGLSTTYTISNNIFKTNYAWILTEEGTPNGSGLNLPFTNNRWETTGTLASPFRPFEIVPYNSVTKLNDMTAKTTFTGNTYGTGDELRFTSECWRSTYSMGSCLAGSSITINNSTDNIAPAAPSSLTVL